MGPVIINYKKVFSVNFNSNGSLLVTAGQDRIARIYDSKKSF